MNDLGEIYDYGFKKLVPAVISKFIKGDMHEKK
jgi:hypothetical protein